MGDEDESFNIGGMSALDDPDFREMMEGLGGSSTDTPNRVPATAGTPVDPATPTQTTDGTPAQTTQEPVSADLGAQEPGTPPQTPAAPENGAQTPADPAIAPADGSDPKPPQPEVVVPDFKTVDEAREWAETQERRRRDLESWADRRDNEYKRQLQQQNDQMVAMQNQMAAVTSHVLAPQEQQISLTQQDVDEAAVRDPHGTVAWLEENYPDGIPYALTKIAELHGMTEMVSVQQGMFQRQQQAQLQRQQQEQMQRDAPTILRQGFAQVLNQVRTDIGAEDFDSVSDQVGKLCNDNFKMEFTRERHPNGITPQAVQSYIMKQYTTAVREKFHSAAALPQQPVPLAAEAVTPTGSGGPGHVPIDEGNELVDDMVAAHDRRKLDFS